MRIILYTRIGLRNVAKCVVFLSYMNRQYGIVFRDECGFFHSYFVQSRNCSVNRTNFGTQQFYNTIVCCALARSLFEFHEISGAFEINFQFVFLI